MQIENYGIQIKIIQCKKSFRIQIENDTIQTTIYAIQMERIEYFNV